MEVAIWKCNHCSFFMYVPPDKYFDANGDPLYWCPCGSHEFTEDILVEE